MCPSNAANPCTRPYKRAACIKAKLCPSNAANACAWPCETQNPESGRAELTGLRMPRRGGLGWHRGGGRGVRLQRRAPSLPAGRCLSPHRFPWRVRFCGISVSPRAPTAFGLWLRTSGELLAGAVAELAARGGEVRFSGGVTILNNIALSHSGEMPVPGGAGAGLGRVTIRNSIALGPPGSAGMHRRPGGVIVFNSVALEPPGFSCR